MKDIKPLINYGDKIQVGAEGVDNKLIPIQKFEPAEADPEKESLKNFLDAILPPIKVTENDLIYYHFVSCDSAIVNDVLKLHKNLQNQMKVRGARETGVDRVREDLYFECFEEIIREVTINCLQRGDLLNKVKKEMKNEIDFYRELYESLIAFSLRKDLQEKKKTLKLLSKQKSLEEEINKLESDIREKEQFFLQRQEDEKNKEETASKEHKQAMDVLKKENDAKTQQAIKLITLEKDDLPFNK